MREHRVYLFTTAVAAVASIVLILSLLGLGADFSANVWPNAGGTSGEGPPISLPESPVAPAGADVFSAPAPVGLPGAVGARGPVLVRVPPTGRRVLRTRGLGEPQRRPSRSDPQPKPTAEPAPAPAPATPVPAAPVPAAAPVPLVAAAQDDDDDVARPQAAEESDNGRKPKHGRKDSGRHGKQLAPAQTPLTAAAPPAMEVGAAEEEDEDEGGDDDGEGRGKERFHKGRGRGNGHG
jgi:hypothetical protein